MATGLPDTLVLKIVEFDESTKTRDTTLYILHDYVRDRYIIRGNRPATRSCGELVYSYECKHREDLVDFICFVIDKQNCVSYSMFNYDNLPANSDDITFHFLQEYDVDTYEVAGYDDKKLLKSELSKYLRLLKNVYNENI